MSLESECLNLARDEGRGFQKALAAVRKRFTRMKPEARMLLANGMLYALTDLAAACNIPPRAWANKVAEVMRRVQSSRIPTVGARPDNEE